MSFLPTFALATIVLGFSAQASRTKFGSHLLQPNDNLTDCVNNEPLDTLTDRLNLALNSSGPGFRLRLCQNKTYAIQGPLFFAAANQEISTVGLPIEGIDGTDLRATLLVNGPTASDGTRHTVAVDGLCANCDGAILRHVRIDGARRGAPSVIGGGNIEMGASNSDQLIEYVKSFDPRGWTCLHVIEGELDCTNATVRFNDIGPCGNDAYLQWADGISLSCRNSHVHGNWVKNPTDGGIVIFGSPGSLIENNTIWVENHTLLGGINMVDYDPFEGDYSGVIVRDNTIHGGFATTPERPGQTKGENNQTVIIKIGIAIGIRTWFGETFGLNASHGAQVYNNKFTGAFGYAILMSAVRDFTLHNNALFDNTSFIGSPGPNCSESYNFPSPQPFVASQESVVQCDLQPNFAFVSNAAALTCLVPSAGPYWPFGRVPTPIVPGPRSTKIGWSLSIILDLIQALLGA